jgi:hypothetical protein
MTSRADAAKDAISRAEKAVADMTDPALKVAAFQIFLAEYIKQSPPQEPRGSNTAAVKAQRQDSLSHAGTSIPMDTSSEENFFGSLGKLSPSNALWSLVAWHYHVHGEAPITPSNLKEASARNGLIIPKVPGATMGMAQKNGKKCFQSTAKGYVLTVAGQLYLQTRFGVKKGAASRIS